MKRHYFDCAASSLPVPSAIEAARTYDAREWAGANPNSLHAYGRAAFSELERARADLGRSVSASRPSEITFTSGGTESNNACILGLAQAQHIKDARRTRVLVSAFEHDSVLNLSSHLHDLGFEMQTIPVLPTGVVDLEALRSMMDSDVALVSVMWVNNETGTIQPIREIASIAHSFGALVHTDAVQALGKVPLSFKESNIDAASITAHKIGGPVGIGAFYLRAHTHMRPLLVGGGQEAGLRSGTVDVRGASIFAAVARDTTEHLTDNLKQERLIAQTIFEGVASGDRPIAHLACGGMLDDRFVPGIVCFIVPGHDSQSLVLALDEAGFEVAGGSACSASSLEASHVMRSLGIHEKEALCELRLSFDARTSVEEANELVEALRTICGKGALNDK